MDVQRGLLIVVSGPAGSGKTTLVQRLCAQFASAQRVVTSTSRAPRPGEVPGADYHFFDVPGFEAALAAGKFYEHAHVHGRYYGTLKKAIDEPLAEGKHLLLNIDVQGAATWRTVAENTPALAARMRSVFINVGDIKQLEARLVARGDGAEEIARRMESARKELPEAVHYNHTLTTTPCRETDYAAFSNIYLNIVKELGA